MMLTSQLQAGRCSLDEEKCMAIGEELLKMNKTVKKLDLRHNPSISAAGWKVLLQGLAGGALEELLLSAGGEFSEETGERMSELLRAMPCLGLVVLDQQSPLWRHLL
eukprot:TRINITY_DN13971_c0_g1_i5.p2 TRINITY_DN13971_c0_g1~~TRINITY_DN13971_c0_g1_i5.p2  ORF type:complete len:107 (-),score=37.75 TRINITY_DN13971_c0_g1_i5:29-349(-)